MSSSNETRTSAAAGADTDDASIVVFADITCPFAHVGLRRLVAARDLRRRERSVRVMSWPLELINGAPMRGSDLAPKIAALRATVAPDLFAGFDADHFPGTSVPALALVAAAYRRGAAAGERMSLALRTALFEEGTDIGDPAALDAVATRCGLHGLAGDRRQVIEDWRRGKALGVIGSPHFFLPGGGDYFCPALVIRHDDRGALAISFDETGFEAFLGAALT